LILTGALKRLILLLALGLTGFTILSRLYPTPEASAIAFARQIASRADVTTAISQQNAAPTVDIAMLDTIWRRDRLQPPTGSLVQKLIASSLSQTLAKLRQASAGQIIQLMVMDKRGALVAADHITHDYDQSDEPKWQLTVGKANIVPILEWRQRQANAELYQISQSVVDARGQIIGAITLVWCSKPGGCKVP
jgi:hypothetical protein